jgi:hypothetical protein
MALTIAYELACAAIVLCIMALVMAAINKVPMPVRTVRGLCLLVWCWLVGWFAYGRPEQGWLLGYELTALLMMAGGCVVLWVLAAPQVEPPPPVGPKINGKYPSEVTTVRSRHIRQRYKRP